MVVDPAVSPCLHKLLGVAYIGYSLEGSSLFYKMYACRSCGEYFDVLGNLAEFERDVVREIGREWTWKEKFMSQEEMASWEPEKNTRFVAMPYNGSIRLNLGL